MVLFTFVFLFTLCSNNAVCGLTKHVGFCYKGIVTKLLSMISNKNVHFTNAWLHAGFVFFLLISATLQ